MEKSPMDHQTTGKETGSELLHGSLFTKFKINGLALESALHKFGDEEVLKHVLRIFAEDTPALLEQIRNVTKKDLREYMIIVHGLKGNCREIFAEPLALQAEKLEQAAGKNDYAYVAKYNATFLCDAEALLVSLKALLKVNL